MWKWLRSWFAWRFSLRRLVVATVFLGVVVGLNVLGPQERLRGVEVVSFRGWPLPITEDTRYLDRGSEAAQATQEELALEELHPLPWSHQTYRLLELDLTGRLFGWTELRWETRKGEFYILIACAIIDALFALTMLSLILFLQIPRRKVAAKVE